MTRYWYRVLAGVAAAAVLSAGPALAGGEKKAGAADPAASSAQREAGTQYTGRHTMEGQVTKVDQKKGTLSLKTAEGTMDLHFPPSALANVKKGDRLAVELALKPTAGGSASPRTSDKR